MIKAYKQLEYYVKVQTRSNFLNLTGKKPAIGYYSYTHRLALMNNNIEFNITIDDIE